LGKGKGDHVLANNNRQCIVNCQCQ